MAHIAGKIQISDTTDTHMGLLRVRVVGGGYASFYLILLISPSISMLSVSAIPVSLREKPAWPQNTLQVSNFEQLGTFHHCYPLYIMRQSPQSARTDECAKMARRRTQTG
jgi:hypothetical protein